MLRHSGFSGIDGCLSDNIDEPDQPALGSAMFSTATVQGESLGFPTPSIVLFEEFSGASSTADPWANSFLRTTGQVPHMITFEGLSSENTHYVVLAYQKSSLPDLFETQFAKLKDLFAKSESILWVTRGARGPMPEANMINGFARVLRSENAGVKFATFDLDPNSKLSDTESIDLITRVYAYAFCSENSGLSGDTEFLERDGCVEIPRIIEDVESDKYVTRETQRPSPEPQPFFQKNRHLEFKLATPGLLDSIYFEDNIDLEHPIQEGEVQIDVKATGVRIYNNYSFDTY